jgi:hypothetical protein
MTPNLTLTDSHLQRLDEARWDRAVVFAWWSRRSIRFAPISAAASLR